MATTTLQNSVDLTDHDAANDGLKLAGTLVTSTAAELNILDGVGSTTAELNTRTDDSAMVDTRSGAGAISVAVSYTALTTTAADALTLAVPTKPAFLKVIKMVSDGGDGTLASTNIVGQSTGTTSITFNDVNDTLVLISDTVSGKWVVLKEYGVTAA